MAKKKTDKKRLTWIINFMNQNFDDLTPGEFAKLAIEAGENMNHLFSLSLVQKIVEDDPSFKELSEQILQARKKIFPNISHPGDLRSQFKEEQKGLREFLNKLLDAEKTSNSYAELLEYDPPPKFVNSMKGKIYLVPGNGGKNGLEYELAELIFNCSPDQKTRAVLGSSFDYIKRCQREGCPNFVIQLHKKEKTYCSNKCAWRVYSALRRQEEKKPKGKRFR